MIAIRGVADKDTSLFKKLRRAEKGVVSVTNDVIANAVKWAAKRPKLTSVSNKLTTRTHTARTQHALILYMMHKLNTHPYSYGIHTILQVFGSPFEADAQVSHLVRIGLADAAASSDSDLLTFACPMTLYDHLNTKRKDGAMVRWAHTCSSDINKMNEVELVHTTCLTGWM